ncbi:IucA/IucC family protein [Streptomyces sp. DT2A-34]|uniref:IucA/IucC family protein n=1 Tax=Streptomyces sp. DT2A-34 TaxID=3051182 RepID=UPI00265C5FA1|nr:IucA/IucC family protein [Streptomyces sp. DT2A-34]MDO0911186.1 IucA/IucC family protein [Streptomyces sp. DT2A-34]
MPGAASDLLEHPDPHTAAQAAAVENLLRCWVRETNVPTPDYGTLRIPLPATGTALLIPVHYWSPTGWHRFGLPHLADAPAQSPPIDAVTLAALLTREALGGSNPVAMASAADPSAASSGPSTSPRSVAARPISASVRPSPASDTSAASTDATRRSRTATAPRPGSSPDSVPAASDSVAAASSASGPSCSNPSPARSAPASYTVADSAALPFLSDTASSYVPGPSVCAPAAVSPSSAAPRPAALTVSGISAATDLVARVADSVRRTATFISERRAAPADGSDGSDVFLAAEQALTLGHPLHPTPKSREGLSESEAQLYSPELRGSFPLHWMAVAPSLLATDSAWTERGRIVPAAQLMIRLAGPELPLPDGYTALPMHPWQLREIQHRPEIESLLDAGLLRDLGAHGAPWYPTSSVRTLHRSDAAAMLKLSLGLRITNSRRENLRKELHRGVEIHRLLRSGLTTQWQAAHPGFDIVRDPAWLAVDGPDGVPVAGVDVMIRHNPFRPSDDVSCVAGLVSPRPHAQTGTAAGHHPWGTTPPRSRLAELVTRLADRTGRPLSAVAAEWFLRYLEQVVRPVLWLDAEAGIALEAHQQNTLLLLCGDGWPSGGRYRDNQGYYFRESRRAALDARLPGIGEHSDTFVSDEVADERFAYYLAINNVLGLIGAFGSQRLADEQLLLAAFRRFLGEVASGAARLRTSLPAHLLDSPVLRCKANLLTRLHGLDELVGPVDTQSVYVTIANPLHS